MFNKARNVVVTNGSFVVNNAAANSTKSGIDRLLDAVATNAILNAGGRVDEVRCYPGTRKEVIGKVEKWMNEGSRGSRMMWLSGPAGAGKSAISQTVAERCLARGLHAANFFFFRGDGTRNNAQPLVATPVYQLRRFYPAIDKLLTDCLTADPLISGASIEEQFKQLISVPIQTVHHPLSVRPPIIFIIDGLDECDDKRKQEHILLALHALAEADRSPFLIFIASRAEPHLVMSFNKLGASVKSIFLDGEYRPQDDIRRFVIAKFDEIRSHHHLAEGLSRGWPAYMDIDAIVNKSSGQFIYAATVMRFIQNSVASPALSLITVLEVKPSGGHSPLAEVDALYSYIFSKAHDIRMVKLILGAYFIWTNRCANGCQYAFPLAGYTRLEVKSFLADLTSIVQVSAGYRTESIDLVFYHASLSDYLKNQSRSQAYYVDEGAVATELAAISLRSFHNYDSLDTMIHSLCLVKEATPELSKSLADASKRQFQTKFVEMFQWHVVLVMIETLYLDTDVELFKQLLQSWVRFARVNRIDVNTAVVLRSTSAVRYFKSCCAQEGVKFVSMRPNKGRR